MLFNRSDEAVSGALDQSIRHCGIFVDNKLCCDAANGYSSDTLSKIDLKKRSPAISTALQHQIRFARDDYCAKIHVNREGGILMASLIKPLNVLVVCAVFAFIGAVLLGAL